MFSRLPSLRFQPLRYCPGGVGNWSGHLPLAADLIASLQPATLVELGTQYGESYFGFCQAVQENGIRCSAHAVDTWEGDPHTGRYQSAVYEEVSAYNAAHYASFSTLLRMTFDDASARFPDGTIDLLHLDGCHTYAATCHDFEKWFPKVSPGGLVLIHDIDVRKADFGAWQFWEEVASRFPHFAFHNGCGLGILRKAGGARSPSPLVNALFGAACDPQAVRDYYALCAERLQFAHRTAAGIVPVCQLFSPDADFYSEDRSAAATLTPGRWTTIDCEIPTPSGRLRFDPVNREAFVEVSDIIVESPSNGKVLWRLDHLPSAQITCAGTAVRVPVAGRLLIFSFGNDPQLYLPAIDAPTTDAYVRFCCRVRLDPDLEGVAHLLQKSGESGSEAAALRRALDEACAEGVRLRAVCDGLLQLQKHADTESAHLQRENQSLSEQVRQRDAEQARLSAECESGLQLRRRMEADSAHILDEFNLFSARLKQADAEVLALSNDRERLESRIEQIWAETRRLQLEVESLQASCEAAGAEQCAIKQSWSWKITAPLRRLGLLVAFRGAQH